MKLKYWLVSVPQRVFFFNLLTTSNSLSHKYKKRILTLYVTCEFHSIKNRCECLDVVVQDYYSIANAENLNQVLTHEISLDLIFFSRSCGTLGIRRIRICRCRYIHGRFGNSSFRIITLQTQGVVSLLF